jgi:hypothetical protein
VWVLALDIRTAAVHHLTWTGTDGTFTPDQLQYLAWIRDASKHVLVSDLFVLNPTPHDYLQPAIAISGGLTALGMAPWLALLLWKPVAVLALFFAVRAYCRRALSGRLAQRAALVLALLYASFGTSRPLDEWLPFLSWGYPFSLLATAALAAALLSYERARERHGLTWAAPLLGLLAAWLHPWQGEALILILVGAEALSWWTDRAAWSESERIRRLLLPASTIALTALPLAYYAVLDRYDPAWRAGRQATLLHNWSLGQVLAPLIPLLVFAAIAYWRRTRSFISNATLVWPLASLAVFMISRNLFAATPLHALTGITIPLAILAVQGARAAGLRRVPYARLIGWALVAAMTIPATVHLLNLGRRSITAGNYLDFNAPGERHALAYLAANRQSGGVLANSGFGALVPGETGRPTYVGNVMWSASNYTRRWYSTFELFGWRGEPRKRARAFVYRTGARFVLDDCREHDPHLVRKLRPITLAVHRFGCATVIEVLPGHRNLP